MTNETTASQPKSIGDDEQFRARLADLYSARDESIELGISSPDDRAIAKLIDCIDNFRAPAAQASAEVVRNNVPGSPHNVCRTTEHNLRKRIAELEAQASATIQAAPEVCAVCKGTRCVYGVAFDPPSECEACMDKSPDDATIQEPVMVAEPVGKAQISAAGWRYRVRKYGGEWTATASKLLIDRMKVADPEFWEIESLFTQSISSSVAQTSAAADYIDAKAEKYLEENADIEPDTGATVFHYGEAGRDYHSSLVELAEEIRSIRPSGGDTCNVPPLGWHCTRTPGHEGACAAWPDAAPMVADPAGVAKTDDRERFEALTLKKYAAATFERFTYGKYKTTWVQDHYEGWCMALAATVKAVPSEAPELVVRDLCELDPAAEGDSTISVTVDDVRSIVSRHFFAAPLADKTGGGD